MIKTLLEIHEDVAANHYDQGIKKNLFQKYWHSSRFHQVLEVIRPVEGAVLDIGCHGGTFTKVILSKIGSKKIYGVDISHSAIEYARKKIPNGHFEVADAASLPYKNNFFEAVICLEVLEHVDNPTMAVSEIYRVLKKNGYAVILVPTDNRLFKLVWSLWTMYYPVWKHAHVQSFQKNNLENLAKKTGLKVDKVKLFNMGMLKLVVARK